MRIFTPAELDGLMTEEPLEVALDDLTVGFVPNALVLCVKTNGWFEAVVNGEEKWFHLNSCKVFTEN